MTKILVPLVIVLALVLPLKLAGVFNQATPALVQTPNPQALLPTATEPQYRIAFISKPQHDGNSGLWVMNSDGTNQIRLTNNLADDWQPVWSPQ